MKQYENYIPENFAEFIGITVHEINNFLSAINGFSQLISIDLDKDDPHYNYLQEIINSVDKTQVFSQQLLALVNRIPLTRQAVTMPELVEMFADIQGKIRCLISTDEIDEKFNILMDKNWTQKALSELKKFSRLCGSEVSIVIKNETEAILVKWEVNINYQHLGTTKFDVNKLFDPYYSSRELFSAKGLGLSWLPGFFYRQQGEISVSFKPNQPIEFELRFAKMMDKLSARLC